MKKYYTSAFSACGGFNTLWNKSQWEFKLPVPHIQASLSFSTLSTICLADIVLANRWEKQTETKYLIGNLNFLTFSLISHLNSHKLFYKGTYWLTQLWSQHHSELEKTYGLVRPSSKIIKLCCLMEGFFFPLP